MKRVTLTVRTSVRRLVKPAVEKALRVQLERAIDAVGESGLLSVLLTDNREIHRINLAYAKEDHATDVLSFEQPRSGPLLGDIVIAVPIATKQAKAGQRSLADELLHLSVHGVAHLIGFDHATKADEKRMFAFEATVRAAVLEKGEVGRVRVPRVKKARAVAKRSGTVSAKRRRIA